MSSHKTSYEKWHAAISNSDLQHRSTCILFSKQQQLQQVSLQQQNDECGCGCLKTSHSYEGQSKSQSNDRWNSESCLTLIEHVKSFGILYNPYESRVTKFIRCDIEISEEKLYNMIHEDRNKKPCLIISIYGGAKYFKMNERLEKEFMLGIIEAATTVGNV
ncbi:unnamed protein product [Rotaria sordida]|uniref:TRPM SLOG domain-containing protein n=1 Tax=Rotaria sordida TaxID=392033 RepID=A0A815HX75_9BILA|nr:unnamed protein product [Rotaria sordida]CAF1426590.1 unnamed protein product [Rotaria sordida]CAF4024410.1 unnamed protein product [Rotaria sordida]CAF4219566.1 unnamed protein product [Rotaria sordida]